MDEKLNNSVGEFPVVELDRRENDRANRIKRMRGWMGLKGERTPGGHPDESGPLLYGDGHSGWNR